MHRRYDLKNGNAQGLVRHVSNYDLNIHNLTSTDHVII